MKLRDLEGWGARSNDSSKVEQCDIGPAKLATWPANTATSVQKIMQASFSLEDVYQQKKCKAVTLQVVPAAAAAAAACTKHRTNCNTVVATVPAS